ncbi:hypothetical protein VPH47_00295 [Stenotrophomonas sp. WED208]|uniref:hypothetical protein n=1 Tax=Stenotrophomonas sp. WED208 TaxID=3112800 RepID=UPI0034D6906B
MCGVIGSTSAQTPSESSQDSNNVAAGVFNIAGQLTGLAPGNYRALHVWKPTAPGSAVHHSHIQIQDPNGVDLFHFGLFDNQGTAAVIGGPGAAPSSSGYNISTSYAPNPSTVTNVQLLAAYNQAIGVCGGTYQLFHNNCQKFARHFMTTLGVKHYRRLFHP